MRDTQRSKVYAAENKVDRGKRFESLRECQAFSHKVTDSAYYRRKYHTGSILCQDGRGRSSACASNTWEGPVIKLPRWSRCELVILHEIAHHAAGLPNKHNWKFAAVLLDLTRHFMGKEAAEALKAAYKEGRVKFTAPRPKRPVSEEQRAILAERLRVAREVKAAKAP